MCNPRRITVRLTRMIREAWEAEVTRVAQVDAHAAAEARLRQHLDESIPEPVLRALQAAMGATGSGWTRVEGGFRHALHSGSVTYWTDSGELEIVAARSADFVVRATATTKVAGAVERVIDTTEEKTIYWGGLEAPTRQTMTEEGQRHLDDKEAIARRSMAVQGNDEKKSATQREEQRTELEAHQRAETERVRREREEQQRLQAEVQHALSEVGREARQVFGQALLPAYSQVLRQWAARHKAKEVAHPEAEGGNVVELEFLVQR
jgi:hypothetical protein